MSNILRVLFNLSKFALFGYLSLLMGFYLAHCLFASCFFTPLFVCHLVSIVLNLV